MRTIRKYLLPTTLYLLLFLLPFQLGTFFFFDFSYVHGVRIDYLAPALYLTDLVALVLIIKNPNVFRIFLNKKLLAILGLVLVGLFGVVSPIIGLYRFLKLLEVIMLYGIFRVKKWEAKPLVIAFTLGAIVQLFLAVTQTTLGHSLGGIWYYAGERTFDIATPGIATVAIRGVEVLRPYGTFPHPNAMAGFYLLLYSFILFWGPFKSPNSSLERGLRGVLFITCSLLIFLSFSKVAILTYLMIAVFTGLRTLRQCTLCSISKIAIAFALASMFLFARGDSQTIDKRIYLARSAIKIVVQAPLMGVGLGNYLYAQSTVANPYPYHFLEPVHNVFLLALAEVGIVTFVLVAWFTWPCVKNLWQTDAGRTILIVILITGMFDHYWLTLQQNILLLPVVFGLLQKRESVLK